MIEKLRTRIHLAAISQLYMASGGCHENDRIKRRGVADGLLEALEIMEEESRRRRGGKRR